METNKDFIERCWLLCYTIKRPVLIIDNFGIVEAYVVNRFIEKSRDQFTNDVFDAQNVTKVIWNLQLNLSLDLTLDLKINNNLNLQSKINNLPLQSFKFGHNNYILLLDAKENEY